MDMIIEAVKALDPASDEDWTTAGLPSVEAVRTIAGDPSITRPDIEKAAPGFKRPEGGADAQEEISTSEATTAEADPGIEPGSSDAGESTPADDQEGDPETPPETEPPAPMIASNFLVRGLLMSIIIKLPPSMRVLSDEHLLSRMAEFVEQFSTEAERMVAVELIKSIQETTPQEIPGELYKGRVLAAMDLAGGDSSSRYHKAGIPPQEDKEAALERLRKVTGNTGAPPPQVKHPSALDGDEEQQAAHSRLYGDPVEHAKQHGNPGADPDPAPAPARDTREL